MISTSRVAGYAAALLSLIFILSGLAHLRESETHGNDGDYSNRPSLVSSALGKSNANLLDVWNRTLGVS